MNILWILFGILSTLLHVQKISAGDEFAIRAQYNGPLALIQEGKTRKFKLAIPHRVFDRESIAGYFYDDSGEQGPVQKFKTACPAYTDEQQRIEMRWKNITKASEKSRLFFLKDYINASMECYTYHRPGPSIQEISGECGQSQGEIYEVGYPVSDEEGNVQFMAVYEVCYSKVKKDGMIYTKHRIDSPSLMLLKVYKDYEPEVSMSFTSPLDPKLKKVKKLYKDEYIYQFVPRYDMPTLLWEYTTLFPFNYTPVGIYQNIFLGMMKYDNFVRLFSQKTDKRLTIYSGTYQTIITEECTSCFMTRQKSVSIKSFWRVIMDDENKATILITQHTRKICSGKTFLCNEDRVVLQNYEDGGCTYKCSLTNKMIDSLRLPKLNIEGKLAIRYTQTVVPKAKMTPRDTVGQSDADAESSSKQVDIADFAKGAVVALITADNVAAAIMQADNAIDFRNGEGNSGAAADAGGYYDGGDNGGGGDGGGGGGDGGGGGG